jgi:hypothetical protein
MPLSNDETVAIIRANRCPACTNWGFIAGPRGGAGQNIYCANPNCRAAFMIAPRHDIAIAQRVGLADAHFYPPQVHVLHYGHPLCSFAVGTTPDAWPIGHSWVGRDECELATCKPCRDLARSS